MADNPFKTLTDVISDEAAMLAYLDKYYPLVLVDSDLTSGDVGVITWTEWNNGGPKYASALLQSFWSRILGRHGGDEVLYDENISDGQERWILRFCGIVADQFPRLAEMAKLRAQILGMSDEDLADSGLEVTNAAFNPDIAGTSVFSGTSIEKVDTLSQQSTRQGRLSKGQVTQLRLQLMNYDYWEDFLRRFDPLFKKVLFAPKARWEAEDE